jgi:hypothetical protein
MRAGEIGETVVKSAGRPVRAGEIAVRRRLNPMHERTRGKAMRAGEEITVRSRCDRGAKLRLPGVVRLDR